MDEARIYQIGAQQEGLRRKMLKNLGFFNDIL